MLAVRLPQSIEKRLEKLARRTKTYYVREAILEHLEEIEDDRLIVLVLRIPPAAAEPSL